MAHASGTQVPQVCNPVRFSHTPVEYQLAPPVLGQQTQTVLRALGLGDSAIADLHLQGVIA